MRKHCTFAGMMPATSIYVVMAMSNALYETGYDIRPASKFSCMAEIRSAEKETPSCCICSDHIRACRLNSIVQIRSRSKLCLEIDGTVTLVCEGTK